MEGVFYGTVTAQGVVLDQSAAYQRFAMRKFMGKPIEVVIRPKRSKRSLDQNAFWWGVVVPMVAEEVGYERQEHEECHYALVARHTGTHTDKISGAAVPNVTSSKMTTKQFAEMVDETVRWAAKELGIVIPLPDEVPY